MYFDGPPGTGTGLIGFTTSFGHLPTSYADFFLNNSPAVSGDVSTVPLPAALPLFGSGVWALAGFAKWRADPRRIALWLDRR